MHFNTSEIIIYNVGIGVACDVNVNIHIPMDFLHILNKELKNKNIHLSISHGCFNIEQTFPDGSKACHSVSMSWAAKIQFLVPGVEHGERLRLPGFLYELLKLLAENRIPENGEVFHEIVNAVHLDISVNFSDFGGRNLTFSKLYSVFDADYCIDNQQLALRFI